jgi:hypothetical protein
MIRTDLQPFIAHTYSLICRSQLLLAESKKNLANLPKRIDDETATPFQLASARYNRTRNRSPLAPPIGRLEPVFHRCLPHVLTISPVDRVVVLPAKAKLYEDRGSSRQKNLYMDTTDNFR